DRGEESRIAGTEDQVGANCNSQASLTISLKDQPLRLDLAVCIRRLGERGIGERLIAGFDVAAFVDDARRAHVDEPRNAELLGGVEQMPRPSEVDGEDLIAKALLGM